jgi:hypothetical protein
MSRPVYFVIEKFALEADVKLDTMLYSVTKLFSKLALNHKSRQISKSGFKVDIIISSLYLQWDP